jgi:hypothetical protein
MNTEESASRRSFDGRRRTVIEVNEFGSIALLLVSID